MSAKKILVISTDVLLNERLQKQLSREDYHLIYTRKTDIGLKTIIEENSPDLMIVDPGISDLRGMDISLRIRRWTPVPILVLTTARTENNEVRALDLTAEDCLSEPFDMAIIAARINNILSLASAN